MRHLYHGDGKGKTTAACGLAVRAAGSGMKVLFAQFFKNGRSSEINVLSSIPDVEVMIPEIFCGRFKNMTDEQIGEVRYCYSNVLAKIVSKAAEFDLIVLDEAVSAYGYEMFDREELMRFFKTEGEKREIVLTGRDPAKELIEAADYVTEMKKVKHPFDKGIKARKGIEF